MAELVLLDDFSNLRKMLEHLVMKMIRMKIIMIKKIIIIEVVMMRKMTMASMMNILMKFPSLFGEK